MKSIKEKREEYERSQCTQDYCWLDVEEAYEAGANYVLDEIENSLQEFTNYEDSLIIRRIIEELKKKRL